MIYNNLGLPNKIIIDCSKTNGDNSLGTTVLLNDEPLKGVTQVNFNASIDEAPTVTITLLADVECISPKVHE